MKPRKVYRTRPKKTGAKKTQRIKSQKRSLVELGCEEKKVDKMTTVEIRDLLKKMRSRKRGPSSQKKAPKPAKKKTQVKA